MSAYLYQGRGRRGEGLASRTALATHYGKSAGDVFENFLISVPRLLGGSVNDPEAAIGPPGPC